MKIIHEDSDGRYVVVMSHRELCSASGRGIMAKFGPGSELEVLDVSAVRERLGRAFEALKPIVGAEAP